MTERESEMTCILVGESRLIAGCQQLMPARPRLQQRVRPQILFHCADTHIITRKVIQTIITAAARSVGVK